jgi:hypothetical protein
MNTPVPRTRRYTLSSHTAIIEVKSLTYRVRVGRGKRDASPEGAGYDYRAGAQLRSLLPDMGDFGNAKLCLRFSLSFRRWPRGPRLRLGMCGGGA